MDDAELVAAARAGDRNAWAAIYDRYADRVYDFCASMLRNRADASEAMQETFLVAFETLGQLAQPERLGAWLYAVAHRAILDRTGAEGLAVGIDAAGDVLWGSDATQERPSRAELAEFVWQAAAGLDEQERALLDLHLRQGLEGPDLASAAGAASRPARSTPGCSGWRPRSIGRSAHCWSLAPGGETVPSSMPSSTGGTAG